VRPLDSLAPAATRLPWTATAAASAAGRSPNAPRPPDDLPRAHPPRPPEGIDSVDGIEGVLYQVAETLPAEVLSKMHAPEKDEGVPVIDPHVIDKVGVKNGREGMGGEPRICCLLVVTVCTLRAPRPSLPCPPAPPILTRPVC
jgi:hypothetical protein